MLSLCRSAIVLAASLFPAVPLFAQDAETPYWASIRAEEANMRVGPGENFPISWVYHRSGLPVKVLRIMQGWRRVEEPDGTRGWISASLLTRNRTAIIIGEGLAAIRADHDDGSDLRWNVEPGVTGSLGDCKVGWCEFDVSGHRGWVKQVRLWGTGEP